MTKILFLFSFCCSLVFYLSAQNVIPSHNGSIHSFNFNNVYLEIDQSIGGRFSSLKLNQEEFLYTNKFENTWGSTFWTSPQATWNWPPPIELDKDPYTFSEHENVLTLTSKVNPKTGFQFVKHIFADSQDTSFTVQYVIINTSSAAIKVAPWQVTRYPAGGITFFPKRENSQQITGDLKNFVSDAAGISWFNYDSSNVPAGTPKFYSDGSEGWLSHLRRNGNLVIYKFKDSNYQEKAPEPENEIELYLKPDRTHQEVELQGAYKSLAAGDSMLWEVKWLIRKLPAMIKAEKENLAIVDFVRKVVADKPFTSTQEKSLGESFLIYPNPSSQVLNIKLSNGADRILMVNTLGQISYTTLDHVPGSEIKIDLSSFDNGLYSIKIQREGQTFSKNLVIEKDK